LGLYFELVWDVIINPYYMPRADISALTKLVYFLTSQWRQHLWRNVVAVPSSSKGPLQGKQWVWKGS